MGNGNRVPVYAAARRKHSSNPSWGTGTWQRAGACQERQDLPTPHGERERVAEGAAVERPDLLPTPHGEREPSTQVLIQGYPLIFQPLMGNGNAQRQTAAYNKLANSPSNPS